MSVQQPMSREPSEVPSVIEHPCSQIRNVRRNLNTATVVVDGTGSLDGFDRAAADRFGLSDHDLGCALSALAARLELDGADLEWCVGHALTEGTILEGEIEIANGRRFEVRVQPFASSLEREPGAALTLTEVTGPRPERTDVPSGNRAGRIESERRREFLARELEHRVKNAFTIVLGILEQTAATSGSFDSFVPTFRDRVNALAVAHRALASADWEGTPLRELVVRVTRPLGCRDRIRVEGDDVILPAPVVSPLAMTLHELATNAVRHGALSAADGQVIVQWIVESGERVRVRWSENGGPSVEPPAREGFGTRMIREGIPYEIGGSTSLEFRPEGVRCEIEAPLGDLGS